MLADSFSMDTHDYGAATGKHTDWKHATGTAVGERKQAEPHTNKKMSLQPFAYPPSIRTKVEKPQET